MRPVDESEEQAARLRERKRKIMAAVALGVICVSLYGWWRKTTPPSEVNLVSRKETAEAAQKKSIENIVYVSGCVEHPGVVKVTATARVLDAINAAGGVLPGADVSKVNLAQTVRDGMQIHVPGQALLQNNPGSDRYVSPAGSSAVAEGKININTADAGELDKLPGVGPAMAAKIVDWRKTNGPFHDGNDLKKVKGMSETKYQKLKEKITW